MSHVVEEIPEELESVAAAGLAWVNQTQGANFKLTGLVLDVDEVPQIGAEPVELGLVLCEGEICMREQVTVRATESGFDFASAAAVVPDIPPLLDPPVGVRESWLDQQLAKYAFVVLLYYRGLW